jgi:hypothetical protein
VRNPVPDVGFTSISARGPSSTCVETVLLFDVLEGVDFARESVGSFSTPCFVSTSSPFQSVAAFVTWCIARRGIGPSSEGYCATFAYRHAANSSEPVEFTARIRDTRVNAVLGEEVSAQRTFRSLATLCYSEPSFVVDVGVDGVVVRDHTCVRVFDGADVALFRQRTVQTPAHETDGRSEFEDVLFLRFPFGGVICLTLR